jgi:hypothetical protein
VPDYVSAYVDDDDDDPAAIQAQIEDRMATLIPGLVFRSASPMRYLIEALAQEVAETRRAATGEGQTFDRIAQFLAEETFGLPVQAAVPASGALTVTYADTLGHEITAGRQLTLLAGDGTTRVGFEVVETVYVPPGSSSTGAGEVAILALEAGVAGNGLVDEPEFEEIDDAQVSLVMLAPTSGGEEGETDADFRDRFARAARRFSPRLITAEDLEAYAADWPGAARAIAYDLRDPGVNEIQTISHSATGGSFTLNIAGGTSGVIQWNASADAIRTALEASSGVGVGDVRVSGGPLPALVTVEYVNGLAATNVAGLSATPSLTGGGGNGSLAIPTTQGGVAPTTAQERKATVAVVDAAGEPLSAVERAALQASMLAEVESGKLIYVTEPSYSYVDVTFTAVSYPTFVPATVEAAAEAAVAAFLSPAEWGRPRYGDTETARLWLDEPTVRFRELVAVLEGVEGLWRVTALTINSLSNTDVALLGPVPNMPRPGTIAGTVTA